MTLSQLYRSAEKLRVLIGLYINEEVWLLWARK
jgi:hypothetical protein